MKRRLVHFAAIVALFIGLASVPFSANATEKVEYVSLGDSLATGILSTKEPGDGFSDYAKQYFKGVNVLGDYTKEYAGSGFTTSDVLTGLTTNLKLQEKIKNANVISISAGANDILKLAKIDATAGTIQLNSADVLVTLTTIAENYMQIIQAIRTLNLDAEIFVMGYYYPFPFLTDDIVKAQLMALTQELNRTVSATISSGGATFVPIYDLLGGDDTEIIKMYIPNPLDIHPNAEGYKLMADALIEAVVKQIPTLPSPEDPIPLPDIIPDDLIDHWAQKEMMTLLKVNWLTADQEGMANPNKGITRAEVATILYNALPRTAVVPNNPGFKDVPESHPAYMAIATLTEAGIFAKTDQFNPNGVITRVQLAKVVADNFQFQQVGQAVVFSDVVPKYWAYNYIQALATNHIMVGTKSGEFKLHANVTRAEFAAVAVRFLNKLQLI